MSAPTRVKHFARLFDRTHDSGFYTESSGVRGQGEQPHSHDGFRYVEAPVIRLSEELPPKELS